MSDWKDFLDKVKAAGGSTDMQTSASGRYPWLFHFCRGQAAGMGAVTIYASRPYPEKVITSPARDWRTRELILADYKALAEHGAFFNDTKEALAEVLAQPPADDDYRCRICKQVRSECCC